jgi:hypothetical protein
MKTKRFKIQVYYYKSAPGGGGISDGKKEIPYQGPDKLPPLPKEEIPGGAGSMADTAQDRAEDSNNTAKKGLKEQAKEQAKKRASEFVKNKVKAAVVASSGSMALWLIPILLASGVIIIGFVSLCKIAEDGDLIQRFAIRSNIPEVILKQCPGYQGANTSAACPTGTVAWVKGPNGDWTQTSSGQFAGNGSIDLGVGAGGVPCLSAPRTGDLANPYLRAFMRALGQAESGGSYDANNSKTGASSRACFGRYQFCGGSSIWADIAGKSDGFGGTLPSDRFSMTPEQQDKAFVVAWNLEASRRDGPSISEFIEILLSRGIQGGLERSNQGRVAGGRSGMCGGWTPLCNPNDPQGKTGLITQVYNQVLAEEISGSCGRGFEDLRQPPDVGTNFNLKDFLANFGSIKAEATSPGSFAYEEGEDEEVIRLISTGNIVDNIFNVGRRGTFAIQIRNRNIHPSVLKSLIAMAKALPNYGLSSFEISSGYRGDSSTNGHGGGIKIDVNSLIDSNGITHHHTKAFTGNPDAVEAWLRYARLLNDLGTVETIITAGGIYFAAVEKQQAGQLSNLKFVNEPSQHYHHFDIKFDVNKEVDGSLTQSVGGNTVCCPIGIDPNLPVISSESESEIASTSNNVYNDEGGNSTPSSCFFAGVVVTGDQSTGEVGFGAFSGSFITPTEGTFTSPFGPRRHPVTGRIRNHNGIDISNSIGTPILAAAAGKVVYVGNQDGYGVTIRIEHGTSEGGNSVETSEGGNSVETLYGHLATNSPTVSLGQDVSSGQKIAEMGNTGISTGPHLHFEIREGGKPVDPCTNGISCPRIRTMFLK